MADIRITVVQTWVIVVSLVAVLHASRCRPCDGRSTVYVNKTGTCDHNITKEIVLNSFKALNFALESLENEMKSRFNLIQNVVYSKPKSNQSPLREIIKQSLPNHYMYKDRFIHETNFNISYAYDILERVLENFTTDHLSIRNELTKVLCNLIMVNRKFHCKKGKLRQSHLMGSFKPKACEMREVFQNNTDHSLILEGFEIVHKTLEETMIFWDTCVVENPKNGKMKIAKQCKGTKRSAKARCSQIQKRQQRRKCSQTKGKKQRRKCSRIKHRQQRRKCSRIRNKQQRRKCSQIKNKQQRRKCSQIKSKQQRQICRKKGMKKSRKIKKPN